MNSKFSERALAILRGRSVHVHPGSDDLATRQREEVAAKTDPGLVAPKNWNPLSAEAKARREAQREALEGRLAIFRDNIAAVRLANQTLNNAAVIQVMVAAEEFIVEVRAMSDTRRQALLWGAQNQLLSDLREYLSQINDLGEGVPQEIIDARLENALNEYAERSLKIAGLDFEFNKEGLLTLSEASAPSAAK